jgi:hypothetical protein
MTEEIIGSEAARRWIPWSERMFQAGQDSSPERGVALVVFLASGAAAKPSGGSICILFICARAKVAAVSKGGSEQSCTE